MWTLRNIIILILIVIAVMAIFGRSVWAAELHAGASEAFPPAAHMSMGHTPHPISHR